MAATDKNNVRVLSYPGNKNFPVLIHKIVNEIPSCSTVMELFAGSGGLSRFLYSEKIKVSYHLNDIDNEIMKIISDFNKSDQEPCIRARFTFRDALNVLQEILTIPAYKDIFIFMDPPYMLQTRKNKKLYKYEFTDNDHERFLGLVVQLKCPIMIIHPVCELYESKLSTFRKVQLKVRYRAKTATECLYMNYPYPEKKLFYGATGKDCWDRQRIKRKGDRTVQKLMSLPPDEKNYILNRIKTELI